MRRQPEIAASIRALGDAPLAGVPQAELEELLCPIVGQKLTREYFLRSKLTADVIGRGHRFVAADIRRVDARGIHCFFDSRCDVIAWHELVGVEFVYRDAWGEEIARGPMFTLAALALEIAA